MVLIESMDLLRVGAEETVNGEFMLDSGLLLAYVVPQQYSNALSVVSGEEQPSLLPPHPRRKLSVANGGGGEKRVVGF